MNSLRRCVKCVMLDTRPGSVFNEEGVCLACVNYGKRSLIDWNERYDQLRRLCERYKRTDGYYDCAIGVSGGKDSHFIVHTLKNELGMNPLLITVADPFTKTGVGTQNLNNIMEVFGCDHITYTVNPEFSKRIVRMDFEDFGEPLRFIEMVIYIAPVRIAESLGIPLIFYGENPAYDYGTSDTESPDISPHILGMGNKADASRYKERGITDKELNPLILPGMNTNTMPIYIGYYVPCESTKHLAVARKYGFRDAAEEWKREGCSEDFEQIDSKGYLVHIWLKYPKFGFQRISDIESRRIREGLRSREDAMKMVIEADHKLDAKALNDFIDTLGYTADEFWEIVKKWNKYL